MTTTTKEDTSVSDALEYLSNVLQEFNADMIAEWAEKYPRSTKYCINDLYRMAKLISRIFTAVGED